VRNAAFYQYSKIPWHFTTGLNQGNPSTRNRLGHPAHSEGRKTHPPYSAGLAGTHKIPNVNERLKKTEFDLNQALKANTQQIRIGVQGTVWFMPFADFLVFFHKHHPRVQMHILDCDENLCEEMLLNGSLDYVVLPDANPANERIEGLQLYTDTLYTVGTSAQGTALPDIANESIINFRQSRRNDLANFVISETDFPTIIVHSTQRYPSGIRLGVMVCRRSKHQLHTQEARS